MKTLPVLFFAGCLSLLNGPAFAQNAPAAPTPQRSTAAADDETVILNPFTVATDKDTGYAASSTLAGTRLNTSLRDIAAAVTVVTPEFMADLGVFTLQEVISYTPNAEMNVDTFNSANNTGESVRIRGVRVHESTQDFFPSMLPIDNYNLEQISVNRGPNSLLFGVGNPGGTLTGMTKRAVFRNRYEVAASADRWHGWRATANLNQVIVPQRAALRLSVLHRDTSSFLQPAYWKENRYYLTGTARLFTRKNWGMTVRALAETGQADRVLPNLRTATDVITPWINAGSPLVDGAQTTTLPLGIVRGIGVNQIVIVDGSPTPIPILNWVNTTRGGNNAIQNRTFNARGPVPNSVNYNGPTRATDYSGETFRFFLEQELGEKTALELAYGQSTRNHYWVRSLGGDAVYVDTNRLLPNGQPNPNVGRYYTEGNNRVQEQMHVNRQLRLTATHLLDLRERSEWIGHHRFAALLSRDFNTIALNDFFEVNTTPLPGFAAPFTNNQSRILRRSYFSPGTGSGWQPGVEFREIVPVRSSGVNSRYFNDRPVRNNDVTDSLVLAVQSKTLKNRLATTLGHRWDDLKGYALDPAFNRRDAAGEAPVWQQIPLTQQPQTTLKNGTFTGGAVLHLLSQLSLQANTSETSTGAGNFTDMYARPLPTSMGTGHDYGIKFWLFGQKLSGTLTRFKSSQDNQLISSVQGLGARLNQMGAQLNLPALSAVNDPRDTQDIVSRGYEFEMIYNPTPGWRMSANVTKNNNVLSNVNSRAARFLEEHVYPLERASGTVVLPNGRTVAQEINDFRVTMRNSKTAVEGRQGAELRQWNANFVTNYRFTQGRLKGFAFGGNLQYRGSAVIGALVDPVTNIPNFANPLMGNAYRIYGLHFRYERKLFERYEWQIALNLRNALDERDLIEKFASATDGAVLTYQQLEPRTWMLSTSVKF